MGEQGERIEQAMEEVHQGSDPWGVDEHFYESRKRALTLAAIPVDHPGRVLELGCSVGALANDLAGRCDELVAVDVSERAVATARRRLAGFEHVRVERRRLPDEWPSGTWDLIVLSEVGYYLEAGDLARLLEQVRTSLRPGGYFLACHWDGPIEDWELQGYQVHEQIDASDFLQPQGSWRDPDFRLDVWSNGPAPSVAQRDGLR